jgi:HD-like signal output (HDOD) protein
VTPVPAPPAKSLADRIRDAVRRGQLTLPPLPELATQLLTLLRDPDRADLTRVGDLIENDPALAAAVLRLANSSLFGGLRQVATVAEASARLGLRQVTTMVTTISHRGHFHSGDPHRLELLHALWDHAVTAGVAAKHVTARGGGDRAEAFLAGLLHDVGKLLVLKGADTLDARPGAPHIEVAPLRELMTALHTELGHAVLREWKVPEPIARAALRHHEPRPAADETLLLRVQVANAVAHKLGAGLDPRPHLRLLEVPAVARLGLAELDLAALIVDVEDEVAHVKSLF